MKRFTFFSFALLLAACSNPPAAVTTTTPTGNDGLGLAITVFAQWQRGTLGTLDGEYDAKEGIFIPCGTTQGVSLKPEDVKIMSGGNCGGQPSKIEPYRLVVVNRTGGKFAVVSHDVTLKDVSDEKGKGEFETAEGVHQLVVDPETMKRIKAEPRLMERVRLK